MCFDVPIERLFAIKQTTKQSTDGHVSLLSSPWSWHYVSIPTTLQVTHSSYSAHTVQLKTGKLSTSDSLILASASNSRSRTSQIVHHHVRCVTSQLSGAGAHANLSWSLTTPSALPCSNAPERIQFPRRAARRLQRLGCSPRLRSGHRSLPNQSPLAQMRPRRHLREPPQPYPRTTKAQAGRESSVGMSVQDAGKRKKRWDLEGRDGSI